MPKQETFLEEQNGDRRIEVLKSYDLIYAREAFDNMDEDAQRRLWESLKPEDLYDQADLPSLSDRGGEGIDFLWDELLECSREDGNLVSFFIVNETLDRRTKSLFVSPDWPSAESFAKMRIITTPA